MTKTIMHVDMNSYFATVEQQANPRLRGVPVGIIKAVGRGCVIAASVEAKKYGVKTGCNVWDAKKLCPQIVLVPSDMDKYFAVTEGLIKIICDYSPFVEVFSIDEAFIDVTESQKLFAGGAFEMALSIKRRIKTELGVWLKCSAGIGFSRITAKLASEMRKPDGLTWLTPENYLTDTDHVAIEEVCGIGYARTKYLHNRGIYTLGQARALANLPPEILDLVFLRVDDELNLVDELDPAKSVSRSYTTYASLKTQDSILKLVRNLIEEACSKLREMKMAGRTFCLSMDGFWARKTVVSPSCDPLVIFDLLKALFVRDYKGQDVRKVGVWISNLMFDVQCLMFSRREEMLRATDVVNKKYGLFTLYPASLLGGELLRPEVTGYLGDKYYRFGNIPE